MLFLNVFFKTLGLLIGITTFLILINLFFYYAFSENDDYSFKSGDIDSNNIIVTLSLNGPIINSPNQSFFGGLVNYIEPEDVKKQLEKLKKLNVKILILKINSPGGTVTASSSLENIIKKFKLQSDTKIYFYTEEILTSGGYWVATAGDKIFANYGAIIGSIGVSGPSWYYYDNPTSISTSVLGQKIETENGIQIFDQNSGNSKDLYNPFRKPTEKELNHLQNIVKEIYDDFILKVSKSRKIKINYIKNQIGALIYTGKQAKDNFLIDEVIGFDELLENIVVNENLENYKILEYNFKNNFLNKYFESVFNLDNNFICKKINANFVSILPLFSNNC